MSLHSSNPFMCHDSRPVSPPHPVSCFPQGYLLQSGPDDTWVLSFIIISWLSHSPSSSLSPSCGGRIGVKREASVSQRKHRCCCSHSLYALVHIYKSSLYCTVWPLQGGSGAIGAMSEMWLAYSYEGSEHRHVQGKKNKVIVLSSAFSLYSQL